MYGEGDDDEESDQQEEDDDDDDDTGGRGQRVGIDIGSITRILGEDLVLDSRIKARMPLTPHFTTCDPS